MNDDRIDFTDAARIPLVAAETVCEWGKTLFVAPHPDDESLGCGGIIALLREAGVEVEILVLSDGTLSHPNSRKFPSERLRELREREIIEAAGILGVAEECVTFFRYRDRSVPNADSTEFAAAVARCRDFLTRAKPQTIFVPWRRDPHPDHRAAFQLFAAATTNETHEIIEYPIWLYELATDADAPRAGEIEAFRLDISSVVATKQRAIRAHRSQIENLIDDDPRGFRLSETVLQNFAAPYEIYFRNAARK